MTQVLKLSPPHAHAAPALLWVVIRLVAQGDTLLPELAQALAVDLDDAGAGRRQGVLLEDSAQVVEQPGDGEHHPRRPEVALPIQEEVGIPVPLCGGLPEPLGRLLLVTGNRLPLQVQLAQHVLGVGVALLGR